MSGNENWKHKNCIIAVTQNDNLTIMSCFGILLYAPEVSVGAGIWLQYVDEDCCQEVEDFCTACIGLPQVLGVYRCTMEYTFVSGHNPSMFGEPSDDNEPGYWYTVTDAVLILEYSKQIREHKKGRCYSCGRYLTKNAIVCRCGDYFPNGEDT